MKKFWKNLFTVGAIAGGAYVGFKGYQRVSSLNKMSKTLPDYLEDLIDERPKINVNMSFNSLSIAIGLSSFAIENIDFDLDEQVNRYIIDYYPCLSKMRINISQYIKSSGEDKYDLEDEFYNVQDVEQTESYYEKDSEEEEK
ncbi:MAG: hypothetical protein FWG98_09355 [Candidatus Cloacimonetes bacterium]|nr:hypothetical protein [Candidatus Cloacimonadota bacterium]